MPRPWVQLCALILGVQLLAGPRGAITLESSDQRLVDGFRWAKRQALAYVFSGDPVGDWYEASLPGRQAFCIRDVSHQSTGAQVLGLAAVTRNMLLHFAGSIAESRDWCAYWEIDKSGRPAPVDYKNDKDFWYNLPANFDLLNCCYRQYLWTGAPAYVKDPVFLNFYDRTVTDYVRRWDKDGDGVPESYREYGHRGIGSYDEDLQFHVLVGADLVAAEAAAYSAYAAIADIRGHPDAAAKYRAESDRLKTWFNEKSWDSANKRFYRAMNQERAFVTRHNEAIPEIWFDVVGRGPKIDSALQGLTGKNVEVRSYYPEIAYRYEHCDLGYSKLMELLDPALPRREYPEVSYAAVGAIAEGMAGIQPDARSRTVETFPRLTKETSWITLGHLPVFENEIEVHHSSRAETHFTNQIGPTLSWRAALQGVHPQLIVDGKSTRAEQGSRRDGAPESYVVLRVESGQRRTVKVP
jgi:hypothetical protein